MFTANDKIKDFDPDLWQAMEAERIRQEDHIELIASENFVSPAVMAAMGSVMTNKYAEGYPGRRYYGGCEHVDVVERIAIDRACELFGAEAANVQPHSGAQANTAVYLSCLKPGDVVLGLDLAQGGHLTHGSKVNFSGKFFNPVFYGTNPDTGMIDYEKMAEIARSVSAYFMVDMAHIAGLVAAGVIPGPVPHADFVTFTTYKTLNGGRGGVILCRQEHAQKISRTVFPGSQGTPALNLLAAKAVCFKLAMKSEFKRQQKKTLVNAAAFATGFEKKGYRIVSGGTDNHLVLVDLRSKGLTGAVAEKALESVGVIVNRNVIPGDPQKPDISSGIRIGSPAWFINPLWT